MNSLTPLLSSGLSHLQLATLLGVSNKTFTSMLTTQKPLPRLWLWAAEALSTALQKNAHLPPKALFETLRR